MSESLGSALPANEPGRMKRMAQLRRLWTLLLLFLLVWAAGQRFLGVAQDPQYAVHSDDLLWMWRFARLPRAALPTRNVDYSRLEYPHSAGLPAADRDYVHGIDQSALERWIFHYLLAWTGKLPRDLPDIQWDYERDYAWNLAQGNVAPPDAVRFVRVVNAAFMIGAVILAFAAIARAATPLAGLVAGAYMVLHSAIVDILWSIGSDPLLWLCLAAALLLWVFFGASLRGAILVGLAGGLAASAKINGSVIVLGYVLWLAFKNRTRLALLAGAVALAVFVLINPILFSRGVFGVPWMLWEMLSWRASRAELFAAHYRAYAGAPQWKVVFYLLGSWWPLLPLLLLSRRFWRLDPAVFWATALVIGHAATVTAPVARYTFPLQAGLVLGLLAAYWPARVPFVRSVFLRAWKRLLRRN